MVFRGLYSSGVRIRGYMCSGLRVRTLPPKNGIRSNPAVLDCRAKAKNVVQDRDHIVKASACIPSYPKQMEDLTTKAWNIQAFGLGAPKAMQAA